MSFGPEPRRARHATTLTPGGFPLWTRQRCRLAHQVLCRRVFWVPANARWFPRMTIDFNIKAAPSLARAAWKDTLATEVVQRCMREGQWCKAVG